MVGPADFADALSRLAPVTARTPVCTSPVLDGATGYRVYLKAENEQHCGSFKARGAFNAMLSLGAGRLRAGVVTASSGNHGLAVATAATALGGSVAFSVTWQAPALEEARVTWPARAR